MPKTLSNLELSRMSREGRASYEGGEPVWPPKPAAVAAPASDAKAIIAGLERVALLIQGASEQHTAAILEQLSALSNAVRDLANHKSNAPEYEFTVTETNPNNGRPIKMIAKVRR